MAFEVAQGGLEELGMVGGSVLMTDGGRCMG
jgi:hypothetical protein